MKFLLYLVAFTLLLPGLTEAATVVRTGDSIAIAADQVVEGDFYGVGGTVAISGQVAEDMHLIGGTVTMNGEGLADLAIVAGSADVHGSIADDVRIVGGTVVVAGSVKGNLVVVANELSVLSTATIGGDVLFFGGMADVGGSVGGSVLGTSNSLRIDSSVGGAINVTTGLLTLGERTEVAGIVSYSSLQELSRSQNAVVRGQITRTEPVITPDTSMRTAVIGFLILLFASLVVHLLLKRFAVKVVAGTKTDQLRAFLVGFFTLFLLPIAALILLASSLGSIIGLLLFTSYFALILLAIALLGAVTGSHLMKFFRVESEVSVLTVVIGVAVLYASVYVPVIGPVVFLFCLIITLGVVTQHTMRLFRAG
jgi:cytoskeletal protein CcmA (bactofilin family)